MSSPANPLTPNSLSMPQDRINNFWYVHNDSPTVFVFVHGIFSQSRTCWLSKDRGSRPSVFWPDLIRADPRFDTPSIYLAGYYTAVDAGDFAIGQCARDILEALLRTDADGTPAAMDKQNIVFVCHSTGGIVVRYLLERNKDLFHSKGVGLVLIASPSLGSVWANVAGLAARYYNQRLGQQLQWNGEALEDIHNRFRDLVNRKQQWMPGLFGMEACENKMVFRDAIPAVVRWLLPNRLKIVETISAGQYFGEVRVLRGTDHFSSVKPDGLNHPSHEFLVTFMQQFAAFNQQFPLPTPGDPVRPSKKQPKIVRIHGIECVYVPAGPFTMGSSQSQVQQLNRDIKAADFHNEIPEHNVTLNAFYIGRYPVTNREYLAFVQERDWRVPYTDQAWAHDTNANWDTEKRTFPEGRDEHPVILVSWFDAVAYCDWLGGRLPTEAEWEKAARGDDGREWPWGNHWQSDRCNCRETNLIGTTAVSHYLGRGDSPFSAADMSGNVWEWCSSLHDRYPYDLDDGREAGSSVVGDRVQRGGAWGLERWWVRCAVRGHAHPGSHGFNLGFRVAFGESAV